MSDIRNVNADGAGVTTMLPGSQESLSTRDVSELGNEEELSLMEHGMQDSSSSSGLVKKVLCVGAGVVDGALPLPLDLLNAGSGGYISRTCGAYYGTGNMVGTVGAMLLPAYGEAKMAMQGIKMAGKGVKTLGVVKRAVTCGTRVGKKVLETQVKDGALERNVMMMGMKHINNEVITKGLQGLGGGK